MSLAQSEENNTTRCSCRRQEITWRDRDRARDKWGKEGQYRPPCGSLIKSKVSNTCSSCCGLKQRKGRWRSKSTAGWSLSSLDGKTMVRGRNVNIWNTYTVIVSALIVWFYHRHADRHGENGFTACTHMSMIQLSQHIVESDNRAIKSAYCSLATCCTHRHTHSDILNVTVQEVGQAQVSVWLQTPSLSPPCLINDKISAGPTGWERHRQRERETRPDRILNTGR